MNSGVGNLSLSVKLIPLHLLPQVTILNLLSHGPIFNVSDTFIGVCSQMGVGGMGATLLVNNTSARL